MKKYIYISLILLIFLAAIIPNASHDNLPSEGTIQQSYAFYAFIQGAIFILIFLVAAVVAIIRIVVDRLGDSLENKPVLAMFTSTLLPVLVIILTIDNLYFLYWVATKMNIII